MAPDSFQPDTIVDGYQIIRQIGAGGFGTVWLCRTQATGDYRALKLIPVATPAILRKELDALVRYRKAAGQLRSPFLMPIEHANSSNAGLYYTMPLADGYGADDPADEAWHPWTLAALIDYQRHQPAWFAARKSWE